LYQNQKRYQEAEDDEQNVRQNVQTNENTENQDTVDVKKPNT